MENINCFGFKEFDGHDMVVHIEDKRVGLNGFVGIYRQKDGIPALGATRLWNYTSEDEAINDVLRLSKLMSRKSAAADLPYSGAKAVLILPQEGIRDRQAFFKSYAEQINELNGQFITGTDVGLTDSDLRVMVDNSPFMIGLGVPAAYFTAQSVFGAIKVSLEEKFQSNKFVGRSFAIQGVGKTGYELLKLIYFAGGEVYISDLNQDLLEKVADEFPSVNMVSSEEIIRQNVDVFCPCALSHSLNDFSIQNLNCSIVVGSANNQLECDSIGEKLHDLGIIYAPDYMANSGGLISVADQFENKRHDPERILKRIDMVIDKLRCIYSKSRSCNTPVSLLAYQRVENLP